MATGILPSLVFISRTSATPIANDSTPVAKENTPVAKEITNVAKETTTVAMVMTHMGAAILNDLDL